MHSIDRSAVHGRSMSRLAASTARSSALASSSTTSTLEPHKAAGASKGFHVCPLVLSRHEKSTPEAKPLPCPTTTGAVKGVPQQQQVHSPVPGTSPAWHKTHATPPTRQKLKISWAGAGIFFFWQLGAMKYLAERYDLSKVPMAGASGGALAAVLAVCKVDAAAALQKAHIMSMEHRIYQKPMSFFGAWGGFIEQVCVGSSVSRRTSSPAAAVCSTSFATRSGWTSCYRTMRRSCAEGRSTS